MRTITEHETYLFDINGYLVVRGALSDDLLRRLNEAVDHHLPTAQPKKREYPEGSPLGGRVGQTQLTGALRWEKPWCDPFRELLVHEPSMPYLNAFLGRGWHMDTEPVLFVSEPGAEGGVQH